MNQAILSLRNLSISVENSIILKDFELELKNHQWIEIIGKNNSGKSIFLNTLYGINKNYNGQVIYAGELLNEQYLQKIRTKLGFYSNSLPLLQDKTLRANISIALSVHDSSFDLEKDEFLAYCLKIFGLESSILKPVYKFCESDQSKIRLIRAICHNPKFLLLDCPFRNLDQDSSKELVAVLDKVFQTNSCTVIMTGDEPSPYSVNECRVFLLDQSQLKAIK